LKIQKSKNQSTLITSMLGGTFAWERELIKLDSAIWIPAEFSPEKQTINNTVKLTPSQACT
jgi:hypothetical protein